ncbi:hypothetical protein J3U99_05735 [Brucella pituitosa]|uniref:hypothetical protein n=1 Tax=Brucella pituitosa TaxID=571256 RepID=UPI0020038A76|nr:hypothetical protein [Brucella pituitosa]MCK4204262.1 hypothetical protein [Brucella pituitosa]
MIPQSELNAAIDGAYDLLALIRVSKAALDPFTSVGDNVQNQILGAVVHSLDMAIVKAADAVDALEQVDCDGYLFGRSMQQNGVASYG